MGPSLFTGIYGNQGAIRRLYLIFCIFLKSLNFNSIIIVCRRGRGWRPGLTTQGVGGVLQYCTYLTTVLHTSECSTCMPHTLTSLQPEEGVCRHATHPAACRAWLLCATYHVYGSWCASFRMSRRGYAVRVLPPSARGHGAARTHAGVHGITPHVR